MTGLFPPSSSQPGKACGSHHPVRPPRHCHSTAVPGVHRPHPAERRRPAPHGGFSRPAGYRLRAKGRPRSSMPIPSRIFLPPAGPGQGVTGNLMSETAAAVVLDDRCHFLAETAFGADMVAAALHDQRGVVQDVAVEGIGLPRSPRPVSHLPAALGQRARQHGPASSSLPACWRARSTMPPAPDNAPMRPDFSARARDCRAGATASSPREVRLGNRDRPCNALVASSGWSTLGACNSAAALRNSGSALAVSIRLM